MQLEGLFQSLVPGLDCLSLENLEDSLKKQLQDVGDDDTTAAEPPPEGRLGPDLVTIDVAVCLGTNIISSDRLGVTSHCNFGSMLANTCVYKGRWVYEVLLGSKGVMQFGWATRDCKFTPENGVGDTVDSYAYDGARVLKWNNESSREYGDGWMAGDVVTCTIDCDIGEVAFYRNGSPLGVAYKDIKLGPGIAYIPGCSLSLTENARFNFGATPLRFPVPGFSPVQLPPTTEVAKAKILCDYLETLVLTQTQPNTPVAEIQLKLKNLSVNSDTGLKSAEDNLKQAAMSSKETDLSPSLPLVSSKARLYIVASHIFEHLGPLLSNAYVIESCILPMFVKLCDVTKWAEVNGTVETLLDLITGLLQQDEYKNCIEHLLVGLMRLYRYTPVTVGYTKQKQTLVTILSILRHPQTRLHAVKHVLFEQGKFPLLIYNKPPTEEMLKGLIPEVWWEPLKDDESKEEISLSEEELKRKAAFNKSCLDFGEQFKNLEGMQREILLLLMTNDNAPIKGGVTSRFVFLNKFRKFVHDYVYKLGVCEYPWPVGLALFHRLVGVVRTLWDQQSQSWPAGTIPPSSEAFVSPQKFYDDSLSFYEVNRLGGVTSHLLKEHRDVLLAEQLSSAGLTGEVALHQAILQNNEELTSSHSKAYKDQLSGATKETGSLEELIDGLTWLYTISAHKQLVKVTAIRGSLDDYKVTLKDIDKKLKKCPSDLTSVRLELERSRSVLLELLVHHTRQVSWLVAYVMTEEKRDNIYWFLRVLLKTIQKSSELGSLFVFVPEYYLATVIQSYQAVSAQFHPFVPFKTVDDYQATLHKFAVFLSNHFNDGRIVNGDCNRVITEVLANFISDPETLKALEGIHEINRINIVKSLLLPYEDRSWVHSNWILARIWKGSGFAFRYTMAPHLSRSNIRYVDLFEGVNQAPCPSYVYQTHVADYLHHNPDLATQFLDSLLNQLNWSFSEFTGMLQELYIISQRTESTLIDSRQLKLCAACFDIAVNLLRVVEFLVAMVPQMFLDFSKGSAELFLCRLCQSVSQILSRVTSKNHAFDMVVNSRVPGMEVIDHFPILAALTGTLVRLVWTKNSDWTQRATTALLHEPSFQPFYLDFLVLDQTNPPDGATAAEGAENKPQERKFSLKKFCEVSPEEIEQVESLIKHLKQQKATMRSVSVDLDEDTVCKICYANPQTVVFRPCGHMSCRGCIAQHMMHHKACFFCTARVDNIETVDEGTPV